MSRKKIGILLLLCSTFLSISLSAVQFNKEFAEKVLTEPVKTLWPHATTFFAVQTVATTVPCWLWGGRSSGILAGIYGVVSGLCTAALLKKTEPSALKYKIAAALAMPALLTVYAWWDAEKIWVPPVVFVVGALPVCAALAAVHYGCA